MSRLGLKLQEFDLMAIYGLFLFGISRGDSDFLIINLLQTLFTASPILRFRPFFRTFESFKMI